MEVLNIPIETIERYKTSKADKELLAFAVGIKCLYSNSVLTNVSTKKVMSLFHVSFKKAKYLIEKANSSNLLFAVKGDSIMAKSFKSNDIKKSIGRTPFSYTSDYCYKLIKKHYSIRELVLELNRIMLLCAVNAVDRDNFTQRSGKPQYQKRCALTKELTLRKLCNISGVSKSEAHRLMSDMYSNGVISKTSAHGKMVIPVVNEYTVEEWRKRTGRKNFIYNPKDGSGWVVTPCSYSIKDRSYTERFKHVIYTHKTRKSACNFSCDTDFYSNPRNAMFL